MRRIVERVLPPIEIEATVPAQAVIDAARSLIDVPYRHQGRTRQGLDCIGLPAFAAKQAGADIFNLAGVEDRPDYSRSASPFLLQTVMRACKRVSEPVPGALMLFRWLSVPHPHHCAIYTDHGTMIHAMLRLRRVREHAYDQPWTNRLDSLWLLPGVIYG